MRFPKLAVSIVLPVFLMISSRSATEARAESASPSPRLALASDPAPARPSMVEVPASTRMSDAPAPAQPESQRSSWWVWAVIAAGVAGVAALVVTSSGKDPACPSDRVCR